MPYHGSILFLNEATNGSLLIFLHPPLEKNDQMIEEITSFGGLVTRTLNNNAIIITSPENLDDAVHSYDHERKIYDVKFVEDTISQEKPLCIQDYVLFDPLQTTKTSRVKRRHSKESIINRKPKRFTAEEDFKFAKTIFAKCKSISVDQRGYESFYIPGSFYKNFAKMNGRTPESWRQRFKNYLLVFGVMNYLEYHILMIQNKKKPLPVNLANPRWLKARIAAAKVDVCLHYPGLPADRSLLSLITFVDLLPKNTNANLEGNNQRVRPTNDHKPDTAKTKKTNGVSIQKSHAIFNEFEPDHQDIQYDTEEPGLLHPTMINNHRMTRIHLFPKLRTTRKNLREPDFTTRESSDIDVPFQNVGIDDNQGSLSVESSPFQEL
ncbi:unnamed protein product [Ambrosiozyma monospora]|uniref:Unnamed protein product n=1 Tax=Ambrosiozyma monospora TaxID=43982 RepID=A0A9W6Z0N3_AMBMO|nr:unnamed protein product [Ambrosiozyma monospora]